MLPSLMKAAFVTSNCWLALARPNPTEGSSCQINLNPDTSDIANTSYVQWVKSATIPSGTTYRYVFSRPFEPEKPYLLFLHGFPESSYSWVNQIDYFTRQGYGVIAPDLLGVGGTDNPNDLQLFSYKNMVKEIGELLDCEGVKQVIGVGHDFGSPLLSRMHTYQPDRLIALAFLDIGYLAPGTDLNAQTIYAINNATTAMFGYPIYGYWLFTSQERAAPVLDAHLDSVYTLAFTYNTSYFKENFANVGGFEKWLLDDRNAPIGSEYVSRVTQEQWKSIARAQGGLDGSLKWYRAMFSGINTPDEEENRGAPAAIDQQVLLVLADKDSIGVPSVQLNGTVPYATHLQVRSVDSGHFVHTLAAREVNLHLESFFHTVRNRIDS